MNPGELDRRISLYSDSGSTSTTGEILYTDIFYGEVWAKYEPAPENETIIDEFDQLKTPATFTIRYIKTINEGWRLKYNNKLYAILSIEPIGRENYLILRCESSQPTKFKT